MPTPGPVPETISAVAILGPGAVGGFLATVLERAGARVTCVTSAESTARIRQHGILLESAALGNYTAHPHAETLLTTTPDLIFITTKAPQLADALQRIPPERVAHAIVVPLLNGLEHVAQIRRALGPAVAVGMISIEASRTDGGHIQHLSPHAKIEIASDQDIPLPLLEHAADFLTRAGIQCQALSSEAQVIWRKLVRLNAIALTTAAAQQPLGVVRTHPVWRQWLAQCAAEAAQLAQLDGVPLNSDIVMSQIDALPATLSTSLQRDTARGVVSELDTIPGAILRRAAQNRLACPTIQMLYTRIANRELGI